MSYILAMADTRDVKIYAAPSPLPAGEDELAAWNALTRDEQIARYREYLAHADCSSLTNDTPDDILAAARAKVAARHRG
jgi:hypothetical protein